MDGFPEPIAETRPTIGRCRPWSTESGEDGPRRRHVGHVERFREPGAGGGENIARLGRPALVASEPSLPVFTLHCVAGPLAGNTYTVIDPGRALISGNCADIGKLKGPILSGLAARAPFFHNGSAATLLDVVNFYDQRFAIGFTEREKHDLVAFLQTL
jgi:hypothetical protein